jgi:hypothetical protein
VTLAGVDVPLTSGTVCIGVKDAVMLRVPVDGSGAVIRCSWILRAAPCKTTHLVLRSPYVCPEPVLGKRSVFGMKWHCKRCVFLYIYIYNCLRSSLRCANCDPEEPPAGSTMRHLD